MKTARPRARLKAPWMEAHETRSECRLSIFLRLTSRMQKMAGLRPFLLRRPPSPPDTKKTAESYQSALSKCPRLKVCFDSLKRG